MAEVTNKYWYPEHVVPDTAISIQRPSIFGNPFKKQPEQIAEYVVAEYWIFIFSKMKKDPEFTAQCMALLGKDLVCSCKNKHVWKSCHGDPLLYLIERNAQTNWKVGDPIQCTHGVDEYYLDIYQKVHYHTGLNINFTFGIEETDWDVKKHISELREDKRFRDATFVKALWSLLLTHIYNEGRDMTDDTLDYGLDWMRYYIGLRKDMPTRHLKRQSPTRRAASRGTG